MRRIAKDPFVVGGPFIARKAIVLNGLPIKIGGRVKVSKVSARRQEALYRSGYLSMAPSRSTAKGSGNVVDVQR